MKKTTLLIAIVAMVSSVGATVVPAWGQISPEAKETPAAPSVGVVEPAELGQAINVHRIKGLFFSGQFGQGDLPSIREQEITRVITLRTKGEVQWDEKKVVQAEGIEYMEIPFSSPESLSDDVFDRVRRALSKREPRTLLHCGSANRVGGVWLPFRVLDEGVDLETALKESQAIGLRTAFVREKAIDYIRRQQLKRAGSGAANATPVAH